MDASTYRTRSWAEIETFYFTLVATHGWGLQPMLDLISFIAQSPYAAGLFPRTSLTTLRVGRYSNFLPGDGELTMVFDPLQHRFVFTYQSHPWTRTLWTRSYPTPEGQDALKRFLHSYVRWFSYVQ